MKWTQNDPHDINATPIQTIYLVIVEDHHTDTMVYPFTDKDKAISEARAYATEGAYYADDYEEQDFSSDGWLFYAQYSSSGDSVRVVESPIVDTIP